jgi:prolipoprotein diacylglyceryltransferase
MLPVLLQLGPITLYSYGLFLAISMFIGLYWFWKIGRDEHWAETKLFDMYFLSIISYFVIGRLTYVFFNSDLQNVLLAFALFSHPGVVVVAGLIAAFLTTLMMARRAEWELWKVMDAWAVVVAVVFVIGSLGAILNGGNPGHVSAQFGYIHPGDTVARIPLDILTFVWSLVTFGIVSRVRKNFRFYSWYKASASVAKDGLTLLVWSGLGGVYAVVYGLLSETIRIGVVPLWSIVGVLGIIASGFMIYWRSGRK